MKIVYWILCVLGTLLPLAQFLPWLAEHGLNIPLMVQQIAISLLSAVAWLDVLVFAIVLIVFICIESQRLNMRRAWLALFGLGVGISLALPLFLLMREHHLANREQTR